MKKQKILLEIIVSAIIVLMATVVKATDIKVEKEVTGRDGTIDFIISGLEIEDSSSYEWAIEKTNGATIKNWYNVLAPDYEKNTIKVTVNATEANHLAVLKASDIGYITIRKVGETTNILDNYKVDLTIPLLNTFTVTKDMWYGSAPTNPAYTVKSIYGIQGKEMQFSWEKITDASVVNGYIDKDHDISGLNLKGKESFPNSSSTTWKNFDLDEKTIGIMWNNKLPTENGLYYLWLKGSGTDVKTVYGQCVIEVGNVEKILENDKNQPDSEETQTPDKPTQPTTQEPTKPSEPTKQKEDKKDTTSAKGTLPNTGKGLTLLGIIGILAIIASIMYLKNKKYRDIK